MYKQRSFRIVLHSAVVVGIVSALMAASRPGAEGKDDGASNTADRRAPDCNNNGIDDALDLEGETVEFTFGGGRIPFDSPFAESIAVFGTVFDLDLALDIEHGWIGDLVVTLQAPGGQIVTLMDRPGHPDVFYGGFSNEGLNIVLDDEAPEGLSIESYQTASSILAGRFLPFPASLEALDGLDMSGDWVLTVRDEGALDTGVLNGWSLIVTTTLPFSQDCNDDGTPDECQLAGNDCNSDGVPDDCEPDCNGNGIADECDVARGTSPDCQPDGVPDECQNGAGNGQLWDNGAPSGDVGLVSMFRGSDATSLAADDFTLPAGGVIRGVRWATVEEPGFSWTGRVRVELHPGAGLSGPDEVLGPYAAFVIPDDEGSVSRSNLGGGTSGHRFEYEIQGVEVSLPPGVWWIVLAVEGSFPSQGNQPSPRSFWLASRSESEEALSGREAHALSMAGATSLYVPASLTQEDAFDLAFVLLGGRGLDCNGNDLPDDCDIVAGSAEDCDDNGIIDECQLTPVDKRINNNIVDACEKDCNGNDRADFTDILTSASSEDCNENWVPDECELDTGDPNGNLLLDECEPDCNRNGVPDEDDISQGVSVDCQPDGVPDECQRDGFISDNPLGSLFFQRGIGSDLFTDGTAFRLFPDALPRGAPSDPRIGRIAAEDFVLPRAESIRSVHWQGFYGADPHDCPGAERVQITIYADRNGAPGAALMGWSDVPHVKRLSRRPPLISTIRVYDYSAELDPPFDAEADTQYWVSVAVDASAGDCASTFNWLVAAEVSFFDSQGFFAARESMWLTDSLWRPVDVNLSLRLLRFAQGGDCNGTAVLDECELTLDSDVDGNGFLDACEDDCNGNDTPDQQDLAEGTSADLNNNQVPDECEPDCNGNDVPDHVDAGIYRAESPRLSPFGSDSPQEVTFHNLPLAERSVRLGLEVRGACWFSSPGLVFTIDGIFFDIRQFVQWRECPFNPVAVQDSISVDAFNALVADGSATFRFVQRVGPCDADSDRACASPSFVQFRLQYEIAGEFEDCNGDETPDECEPDCNLNGLADGCDIERGLNLDCNNNGIPDECEIEAGAGEDCQENLVLDDCEVSPRFAIARNWPDDAEPVFPGHVYTGTTLDAAFGPAKWYRYLPSHDGALIVSTCGSSFDTTLSIFSRGIWHNLIELACNDDFCESQSLLALDVAGGTEYFIKVGGYGGEAGDFVMELFGPPGTVSDQDANGIPDACDDCNRNEVPDGQDIAQATSNDDNENGVPDECEDCNGNAVLDPADIAGGTSADCNDNGTPDECEIAGLGARDCQPNGLIDGCEVRAAFAKAQDDCFEAEPVCPRLLYVDSTDMATNDGAGGCADSDTGQDVWYRYTPAYDGTMAVSLCGSGFDTVLSVHSACIGDQTNVLACNDDSCGLQSDVALDVLAGTDYFIRVAGFGSGAGGFQMVLDGPGCLGADDNLNGVPDECDRCPFTCGDFNGNGLAEIADFAMFAWCFGRNPHISQGCDCSDLNLDGRVDFADFTTFALLFNQSSSSFPPACL